MIHFEDQQLTAGRRLCPCVLQVEANVMVWQPSPHDPCEPSYLAVHNWMS